MPDRRTVLTGAVGAAITVPAAAVEPVGAMHGLIGSLKAQPGRRDALVAILLDGVSGMPGCLSYVVALDPADADTIWITEVWDSKESHATSLNLPRVRAAIAQGRPLIAGMGEGRTVIPVGGHGLRKA